MTGRVAIVTGAGRGIGRATAVLLAEKGARVMAVARTSSDLESLASEASVEVLSESVATGDGCVRIIEETRRRLGPIEILVNNAGVGSAYEPAIWDQTTEIWRSILAVNLDGPFHLTRLAVGDMIGRRFGRIIMVSSTAGEVGGAREAAYDTSKHGLLGLMRSVAQDVVPFGVTCNAVLPGWVQTSMTERSATAEAERREISVDEVWAKRRASYAAGRIVTPEEVAAAIAFLASDEASGVNGESLRVTLGELR